MMYFFVFTPPKTFIMVRLASLAMSVKYARGFGDLGSWLPEPRVATTSETASRAGRQTLHAKERPRGQKGFLKIMSHRHSRWRPHGGQAARLKRASARRVRVTILFEIDYGFRNYAPHSG